MLPLLGPTRSNDLQRLRPGAQESGLLLQASSKADSKYYGTSPRFNNRRSLHSFYLKLSYFDICCFRILTARFPGTFIPSQLLNMNFPLVRIHLRSKFWLVSILVLGFRLAFSPSCELGRDKTHRQIPIGKLSSSLTKDQSTKNIVTAY